MMPDMQMTAEDLKKKLTPEQYNVCVLKGTEPPGTGKYTYHHELGVYSCVICGEKLFESSTKYDSGSGWPAFFQPISEDKIKYMEDHSFGMNRSEIQCANCNSHLGHVFEDPRTKTGLWYCVNSLSLNFEPASK